MGGDPIAELYRTWGPAIYRRCLRLLREPEAARDATQEVFVKVVRDIRKLEERETALPWIYRVAPNHCLNVLRDARRRGERPAADALELVPAAPEGSPERQLARQVLSRFDLQTQAIAVGVLVDGMEREQVAGLLGISRKTVQRKLTRFLDGARAWLTRGAP